MPPSIRTGHGSRKSDLWLPLQPECSLFSGTNLGLILAKQVYRLSWSHRRHHETTRDIHVNRDFACQRTGRRENSSSRFSKISVIFYASARKFPLELFFFLHLNRAHRARIESLLAITRCTFVGTDYGRFFILNFKNFRTKVCANSATDA